MNTILNCVNLKPMFRWQIPNSPMKNGNFTENPKHGEVLEAPSLEQIVALDCLSYSSLCIYVFFRIAIFFLEFSF